MTDIVLDKLIEAMGDLVGIVGALSLNVDHQPSRDRIIMRLGLVGLTLQELKEQRKPTT